MPAGVGDDAQVTDAGFLAFQKHGAVLRNPFDGGEIRQSVAAKAPGFQVRDQKQRRTSGDYIVDLTLDLRFEIRGYYQ